MTASVAKPPLDVVEFAAQQVAVFGAVQAVEDRDAFGAASSDATNAAFTFVQ